MPSSIDIVADLARIAVEWWPLAVVWHLWLGILVASRASGWRPGRRAAGLLLVLPIPSVGTLAWVTGNPFNAAVFVMATVVLSAGAWRLGNDPVPRAAPADVAAGGLLVLFGWCYPHFLEGWSGTGLLYAAPLGLIPCPTLSALMGLMLLMGSLGSAAWARLVSILGLAYGAIGVVWLGVGVDSVLLAGALWSLARQHNSSDLPDPSRAGARDAAPGG